MKPLKLLILSISLVIIIASLDSAAVTLNLPINDANVSSPVIFNCSATAAGGLSNITLYGNWTGTWTANQTDNVTGISNSSQFTKTITQGRYVWNCLATDTSGTKSFAASNNTVNVDNTPPSISSVLLNETYLCGTASEIRVNCTATDSFTGVKNATIIANSPSGNYTFQAQLLSGNTYYSDILLNHTGIWNFTCKISDYANNNASKNSSNLEVYYTLPDLTLTSKDISFSNQTPYEGQNITISALIHNNGCQSANNFPSSFYIGNTTSSGIFLGNRTLSVSPRSNASVNVTWDSIIGPNNFFVWADSNQTITEGNTTNNKANKTLNVNSWQDFYGFVNSTRILGNAQVQNMTLWFNATQSTGIVFVADKGSIIHWTDLVAMGRAKNNTIEPNDFSYLDTLFNMTNFSDSIANKFTSNGKTPLKTKNFTVDTSLVPYVPIINSTNSSNFITGIMWDSYYDTNGQFDLTDKEKVVFATQLDPGAQGLYGKYDYEVTVPVKLRNENSAGNSEIYFYYELS